VALHQPSLALRLEGLGQRLQARKKYSEYRLAVL
jgi:hypothetical protein